MEIKKGDIFWTDLLDNIGSEPSGTRPVIVVQSNPFNESSIRTVIVVILTTNQNLSKAPGNFVLKSQATNLPKDSVVNVSQIFTIDKSQLRDRVGQLKSSEIKKMEEGIKLVLGIVP